MADWDKPEYSKKEMYWAVTKTAFAVFVIGSIFFRFEIVEKAVIKLVEQKEDDKIYLNDRIDKKTARNKDYIDANKIEIDKLKQPNSDNSKKNSE